MFYSHTHTRARLSHRRHFVFTKFSLLFLLFFSLCTNIKKYNKHFNRIKCVCVCVCFSSLISNFSKPTNRSAHDSAPFFTPLSLHRPFRPAYFVDRGGWRWRFNSLASQKQTAAATSVVVVVVVVVRVLARLAGGGDDDDDDPRSHGNK